MEQKKRLFDATSERYTLRGEQLDLEVATALRPILDSLFSEGYSTRDAESLLFWTIGDLCVSHRLGLEIDEHEKLKQVNQA